MGIFKCLNYAERTTPCLALCMLLLAWSSACNANSRLPQEGAVAGPAVTKGTGLDEVQRSPESVRQGDVLRQGSA